jgi:hypothetical protein
MPDQVGCLPFFPVMPHNHSSPGQGGQLDETSWGARLYETYYYLVSDTSALEISADNEKYTNDQGGIVVKEIVLGSLKSSNLVHRDDTNDNIYVTFDIHTTNATYQVSAGIYLNNSLLGSIQTTTSTSYTTKAQTLSNIGYLKPNDIIQLKALSSDPSTYCYIRNFRIYFLISFYFFKNVAFYDTAVLNRPFITNLPRNPFNYTITIN